MTRIRCAWAAAAALTLVAMLTAGCSKRSLLPEPMPVDRAECARCRMLISAASGGGEIVSRDDDTRFYDDVGCLAADAAALHGDEKVYVRVAPGTLIEARRASYARPDGVQTPMGSGLVAFKTVEDAAAADASGRALTWADVLVQTGAASRGH